jgi:hypothetical protein
MLIEQHSRLFSIAAGCLILPSTACLPKPVSVSTVVPVVRALPAAYTTQPPEAASTELTYASAMAMSTAELARRLLARETASQITGHQLPEPIFAGGPLGGVEFFTRPHRLGPDLCRRSRLYVDLEPIGGLTRDNSIRDVPVIKEGVSEDFQIALAPDCRLKPDSIFAYVRNAAFAEGATALLRLAAIQRTAKSARPLPVELRCTSELSENPCGNNFRAVLAGLPLHRIFSVEPLDNNGDDTDKGWRFSVFPGKPADSTLWEVRLDEASGQRPMIRMHWKLVPPF